MSSYEELDAFKACHQLTLAAYKVADGIQEKDPELAGALGGAALIASSRIVRGAGSRNRRLFWLCVDRSLSALSEIEYHLKIGYALGLISKEDQQNLESLRGRATFYTGKLVLELMCEEPPEQDGEAVND